MGLLTELISWLEKNQYKYGRRKGFVPYSDKKTSKPYPEITGYSAKTFCDLYKKTGKSKYKRAASMACDALLKISDNGLFPQATEGMGIGIACLFDIGVIVNGLLETYEITGKERYFDFSLLSFEFMNRLFQDFGHFPISTDLNGNVKNGKTHYYLAKISEPLAKAYGITGSEYFLDIAEENIKLNLKRFLKKEFFYSNIKELEFVKRKDINNSHFMCYAVEGMMKSEKFVGEVVRCAKFLAKRQTADGGILFNYNDKGNFIRDREYIPSVAQCISIWNFANKIKNSKKFSDAITNSIRYIEDIYEGKEFLPDFKKGENMCSWSVIFAVNSFLDLGYNENSFD